MATKASLVTTAEVTLASAVASFAVPTDATFGVDISVASAKWRDFGNSHIEATIILESSAAMNLTDGVGLYGYRTSTSKWYLLGKLNDGLAISTLGANTGFAQIIQMAGCFDRLAIGPLTSVAVTPSTGTVTVKAVPIRFVEES